MILAIRDFSDELAEKCKQVTGKGTSSQAVLMILNHYFDMDREYRELKHKLATSERKLEELLQALQYRMNAETVLESTLSRVKDKNAFYLEVE